MTVFEDNVGGIVAAKTAQQLLGEVGIEFTLTSIGVGDDSPKIKNLRKYTDYILSRLDEFIFE